MTQTTARLIIAMDEYLGILLLCWLRYTGDYLFWPALVAWAVATYAISYRSYWRYYGISLKDG